ncbi:hypothetical protein V6N00_13870 [Tersicoccus sp. MR15.9]|uniref:hypothetical protein n=1 Tax=Tersicoccus mangrovi TaxID=3121635 RepID=UPI002FE61A0F
MTAMIDEPYTVPALERHRPLEVLCRRLERIIHGQAAEALLAADLPEAAGLVILPAWTWAEPLINVGRKGVALGGGAALLMPVRVDWASGPLALVTDPLTLTYRARGLGHSLAGQTRLIVREHTLPITCPVTIPSLAQPVFVGTTGTRRLRSELERLARDGKTARWEQVAEIEPVLRSLLHKAHSFVSHEVAGQVGVSGADVQPVLDEVGLDGVLATMMYGDQDSAATSPVLRLIDLCLEPGRFMKVDPFKFMATHLRRDAEKAIRDRLGDPHIGPKIRELARRFPGADVATIVAEYRKVYPQDRLAAARAEAALSVGPDAMARWTARHRALDPVGGDQGYAA